MKKVLLCWQRLAYGNLYGMGGVAKVKIFKAIGGFVIQKFIL